MFGKEDVGVSVALAVFLWVSGAVGIGASFVIENPYSRTLPLAVLVTATLFLLTRTLRPQPSFEDVPVAGLLALYFVALAATVFVYQTQGYQRTVTVHVLTMACYVLAGVLIFTPTSAYLKLATVVVTGIVQRAMAFYASPLYLGNDVFGHNRIVAEIATVGSLQPLANSKYYYAAFYHLLIAIQKLITGVSVRHAAFFTTVVVLVGVPAVALYLITGRLWDERAGVLSALLYTASDFALHWALTPQVTSLGIVFYSLTLLAVVSYIHTGREKYDLLYVVAFASVALTHQVSTVIAFLGVAIFLAFWAVLNPDFRARSLWMGSVSLFIMFIVFSVTKFNGPRSRSESFLLTVFEIWQSSVSEISLPGGSSSGLPPDAGVAQAGSAALNVWHVGGTAILLGLAIFGGLRWFANDAVSRKNAIAFGGIVTVLFPTVLAGPVVGLRILIPWRWFAFLYVPLVILAAPGVVFLLDAAREVARPVRFTRSGVVTVGVVVLLVGPYAFLMGGNSIAARDGPPLDQAPGAERYAVTEPEVATLEHTMRYVPEDTPVLADFLIAHNILGRHYQRDGVQTIHVENQNPNTIGVNESAVLVNREYMQSGHVKFRFGSEEGIGNVEGLLVHGVVPVDQIDPLRREVIYSSGTTQLLNLAPESVNNRSRSRSARNTTSERARRNVRRASEG